MSANGLLGSLNFPSLPGFAGRLFASARRQGRRARAVPRVQRLAHRRVVRRRARALHPARDPADLGPGGARATRCAASRRRAATRSRSPRTPSRSACPSLHSDHWDPFWKACSDDGHRRVHAHRLVGQARDHRARRADRRDDHAAADEHRAGRGRPHPLAGVPQVPRRARSRCPRAGSVGSPTSSSASTTRTRRTRRGPSPTSATRCRARCSRST